MHRGDTAIVSMQYSYLPSWITILVDPQRSRVAAHILFDEIYAYWKTLPKDKRPRLYLHGLSLGRLVPKLVPTCSISLKIRSMVPCGAGHHFPALCGTESSRAATLVRRCGNQLFAMDRSCDSPAARMRSIALETVGHRCGLFISSTPATRCLLFTRVVVSQTGLVKRTSWPGCITAFALVPDRDIFADSV